MESYTVQNLRKQVGELQRDRTSLLKQYKIARTQNPWDTYKLSALRDEIKAKQKELQARRLEMESYQLEFAFGA